MLYPHLVVILNGPSFVGPVKDLATPTEILRSSKPSLQDDKTNRVPLWKPVALPPFSCHSERLRLYPCLVVILNGPSFVGPVKDLATPTEILRSSKPSLEDDKTNHVPLWKPEALPPFSCHSERLRLYPHLVVILNGPSFVGPVKDLATPTEIVRSSKPSLQDDKTYHLPLW